VKDFQRLVVLISTNFTLHNNFSFINAQGSWSRRRLSRAARFI
jgi:hypothetical protein